MAKKIDLSAMASKGGKKAAANMTAEERSERASQAAAARWSASLPRATHGDSDHPLRIADLEIPCYVLNDGRRVITQRGFQAALGMNASGGARRLLNFVGSLAAKGIDCKDFGSRVQAPIRFVPTEGGKVGVIAHGFEATALADMCDVILDARKAGVLTPRQRHYADQCEITLRSFARVGIIALVDEATGYQYDRPRRDLQELLKKFLAEELVRYVGAFPSDYFKYLCQLRGVELRSDMRLPPYFGHLTNDLIYKRIAPGLLQALKERRLELGSRSNNLYNWTSEDKGYPALQLQLGAVIALMKVNKDWDSFYKQLNQISHKWDKTPGLFDDPADWQMPDVPSAKPK